MQYTFPLLAINNYYIEDFIVSASNKEAYNYINNWPAKWGNSPFKKSVILYGPYASGKTHLAKIWQYKSSAYEIKSVADINEDIFNDYNAFYIENIVDWDEVQLLHIFNWLNENNKYLLLTASRLEIDFKLPDLASRINSIARINVMIPDDELIKILLFKLFSNYSIKISFKIQRYLLTWLPRRIDEIIKFVHELNHFALANKRGLTIPLIKEFITSKK